MAPLPPNLTWRAWLDYEGPGGQHSIMLRFPGDRSQAVVEARLNSFAALLLPLLYDDVQIVSARASAPQTTFSFPLTVAPAQGAVPGAQAAADYPRFVTFSGRTNTGRRVRYFLYNTPVAVDADYRVPVGVTPDLDNLRVFLDDITNDVVAIDAAPAFLYNYYNTGYNAYLQRRARF